MTGHIIKTIVVMMSIAPLGCKPSTTQGQLLAHETKRDALILDYYTNDIMNARRAIREIIGYHEDKDSDDADGSVGDLWVNYGRLYCIETVLGNEQEAMQAYNKSRKYYIEHVGMTDDTEQIRMTKARAFNPEICGRMIVKWDIRYRAGMTGSGALRPRYWQKWKDAQWIDDVIIGISMPITINANCVISLEGNTLGRIDEIREGDPSLVWGTKVEGEVVAKLIEVGRPKRRSPEEWAEIRQKGMKIMEGGTVTKVDAENGIIWLLNR